MSRQVKVGVGLAAVLLFGVIVYSTLQQSAHKVEVCVDFKGRTHCATAAGESREAAVASGHQIGCSLVTSGRDENMVCLSQAPASVKDLR